MKTSRSLLVASVVSVVVGSAVVAQTGGQVDQCGGCESSSGNFYQEVPCGNGERAFIKVTVERHDGICQRLIAPPYFDICIPFEPCKPYVLAKIGVKGGPISMVHFSGREETVDCGDTRTLQFGGSCGVSLDVDLICSPCDESVNPGF